MIEWVNRRPAEVVETVTGLDLDHCRRCLAPVDSRHRDELGRRYCRDCLEFGLIREDTLLYRFERKLLPASHVLNLAFPLSLAQKEASRFVESCRKERKTGFLQAVCGAGKTEILYEPILHALQEGDRICLAIPRKDIVAELAIRLKSVFPNTRICALHEGSKDDSGAHLVVSTIHQLIRYHQEFDWMILDEADAFPYRDDPLLHRLLEKALKPGGSLFLMSATVNPQISHAIRRKTLPFHILPSRFHGKALDLPRLVLTLGLEEALRRKNVLPGPVRNWLASRVKTDRQALLFVPSIVYGTRLESLLNDQGFPSGRISSIQTDGPAILRRFRQKEWRFLVATTILERGVTFKNIDVGVLSAERGVFDMDTLVQISGRVGRDPSHPHGEIVFFCEDKTAAMTRAVRFIKNMNTMAKKAGSIQDGM